MPSAPSQTCLFAAVALLMAGPGHAAVSDAEAARLGKDLTPVGAERSGTKDGAIPAWDGGLIKAAPGWKPGDKRIDPFAAEKPLFSIDATSADKHAGKPQAPPCSAHRVQRFGYTPPAQRDQRVQNDLTKYRLQLN